MNEQQIFQRKLAQFLASEFFYTITEDDVLKKTGQGWTHKGQPLTEGQINVLKKEAKTLSETNLYSVLLAEIRWHARQALEKAVTENDIIAAKLLAYFADVLESKIEKLKLL